MKTYNTNMECHNIKVIIKMNENNDKLIIIDPLWTPPNQNDIITDPTIIKLINSTVFQRLKNISQNGLNNYIIPLVNLDTPVKTTRFDHSVGAMLIAMKLGASKAEMICALLHDLSHTSFSHIVDYMNGKPQESYHEVHKKSILKNFEPELKEILGDEWYKNIENMDVVKENKNLAIDIVDYLCRDSISFNIKSRDEVYQHGIQLDIKLNKNGIRKLCCKNVDEAKWWLNLSETMTSTVYNTAWNIGRNIKFAEFLNEITTIDNMIIMDESKILGHNMDKIKMIEQIEWRYKEDDNNTPEDNLWIKIADIIQRNRITNPYININGIAEIDPSISIQSTEIIKKLSKKKELQYRNKSL